MRHHPRDPPTLHFRPRFSYAPIIAFSFTARASLAPRVCRVETIASAISYAASTAARPAAMVAAIGAVGAAVVVRFIINVLKVRWATLPDASPCRDTIAAR